MGDAYVKAGVRCHGCVQVSNDTLESTCGREICEERRVLPVHDTRHDEILEIVRDIFNTFPFGRWSS